MTRPLAICLALALLALAQMTGLIRALDLAHPFWALKATLIGAGIGGLLAAGLFWLDRRALSAIAAIGFLVALITTWRAARIFIDSADYEPLAGKVWFLGYHVTAALFVAVAALGLARVLGRVR